MRRTVAVMLSCFLRVPAWHGLMLALTAVQVLFLLPNCVIPPLAQRLEAGRGQVPTNGLQAPGCSLLAFDFDTPDYFVAVYVLRPLREFGLRERQRESERHIGANDTVRMTPLFRRFMGFANIPSPLNH